MPTFIVGHLNNDTDSVVSAIALSYLEKQMGKDCQPAIASPINRETGFVLKNFGLAVPEIIPEGEKKVILVDHNEPSQISPNIQVNEIQCIIDHHKLGGLKTSQPISVRIKTVGSTSTIITGIFQRKGVAITKEMAGILIAGILSDTLKLTSPTTHDDDKGAVDFLNKTAGLDVDSFTDAMFEAKSDIAGMEISEIVECDYKTFEAKGKKFGIGVWETVKPDAVIKRGEEILGALKNKKKSDGLDFIFFAVVDILNNESVMFMPGTAEKEIIRKAYGANTENGLATLPGVVSRKKQMTPQIEKALA